MIEILILDYSEWTQLRLAHVLIPNAAYKPTAKLTQIDKLLQDEAFVEPNVNRFKTKLGRPTVPIKVYLRMMFLKHYTEPSDEDYNKIWRKSN